MQYYSGNSKIFLPIVHNAVNARVTRFTNQIFPVSGRNVEVISENGDIPHSTMALAEHYIRRARLRTDVIPALMRNGDVEGQYTLYVGWEELKRTPRRRSSAKIGSALFSTRCTTTPALASK
jgi:hypothetical protein